MRLENSLVVGCSFAKGHGLELENNDPQLWINQLLKSVGCNQINNCSKSGVNNDWIFHKAISEIIKHDYDILVVAWSAIPRFNVNFGLELYNTNSNLNKSRNISTNTKTYSSKWIQNLYDNLIEIHNDHWDFLNLVKYVNVLIEIQSARKKHIVFVNSLLPFPQDYFNKKNIKLPSELSELEQNMLSVDTRSDEEILQLYDMIHEQYQQHNGIRENYWLNLYQSLRTLQVDSVSKEDNHPGYNSQNLYADLFSPRLKNMLEQN